MSKELKIFKGSAAIVALALATTMTGWAALASCGTAPGTTLATLLSPADNANIPPNGCGQTDLGFNAFSTPTSTGTITGPTTAQIDLSTSGGTAGSVTTQAPIFALYTLTGGNSIGTGGGTIISSFDATGKPVAGQDLPSNPPDQWAVNGLALTFSATSTSNPTNAETIEVQQTFCLGQTTFTCLTSASNYGYLQITEHIPTSGIANATFTDIICTPGATGCTQTTATTAAINLAFAAVIPVATQLSIDITRPNMSGNTLALTSIQETWDQMEISPEPSTFILYGSALVGLGALRFLRRAQKP
jgi:hypothetical protein